MHDQCMWCGVHNFNDRIVPEAIQCRQRMNAFLMSTFRFEDFTVVVMRICIGNVLSLLRIRFS